jgi:3-phenylpropionate/trans-cinnamate dioxygenase ferredoxin reductase component
MADQTVKYLLVGGGVASVFAAQSIREKDKDGPLMIVGSEPHFPYDRPPLSKGLLRNEEVTLDDASSKFDNFYPDNAIDLRRGVEVVSLDRGAKEASLSDGSTIGYEKLLIATGSRPRLLEVPGEHLSGVHHLRTADDALAIRSAVGSGTKVLMVGAGYIGLEAGASLVQRGADVTILDPADRPWPQFSSSVLGGYMRRAYEQQNVKFLFGEEVAEFAGGLGLEEVRLRSGRSAPCEVAVVGVGVIHNSELAARAGLAVDEEHGIEVDRYLRTPDESIWAAGDVAYFEDVVLGKRWHAEHHLNAKWQGRTAGANMAGEQKPYDEVAYFFADMFDFHMILRGDPDADGQARIFGDVDAGEFVEVRAGSDGDVILGSAISHDEPKLDKVSDKLEALIRERKPIGQVEAEDFELA